MAQCPAVIKEALSQDRWRLDQLWSLGLATENVAVAELPLWQYDGVRFQVRSVDVAAAPDRYPHHYARVKSADLSHPIHVIEHRERLAVLDGFHRLLKAVIAESRLRGGHALVPRRPAVDHRPVIRVAEPTPSPGHAHHILLPT